MENPNKYNVKGKLKKASNQHVVDDEGLADHRKNKFEDEGDQKKKNSKFIKLTFSSQIQRKRSEWQERERGGEERKEQGKTSKA